MGNKDDNKSYKRRDILKNTAVGLTAAGLLGKPAVAKSSPKRMISLRGTEQNPVTEERAQKEMHKLLDRIPSRQLKDLAIYGLPNVLADDQYTASYDVKIGEKGVPITSIGYAKPGKKSDYRREIHEKANRRRTKMENAATYEDYISSGSTDGSSSTRTYSGSDVTFEDGWDKYAVEEAFAEGDNGEISLKGQHALFDTSQDGSSSYDQWGASFNYRSTPHKNNGEREIDTTKFRQDWSEGQLAVKNDHVYDTSPSGEHDGSWSTSAEVNASAGTDTSVGTAIGWSYSQPDIYMVERTDQNGNDGDAVWKFDAESEPDPYDSTLDVTCGSVVFLESPSYCTSDVGEVTNWSHFNDWAGSSISCSESLTVNICSS